MKKGDTVFVISCAACPSVALRNAIVKEVDEVGSMVRLSFGKGRPQKGRPEWYNISDLRIVNPSVIDTSV